MAGRRSQSISFNSASRAWRAGASPRLLLSPLPPLTLPHWSDKELSAHQLKAASHLLPQSVSSRLQGA